jgi:hypothetical protein
VETDVTEPEVPVVDETESEAVVAQDSDNAVDDTSNTTA